MKEYDTDPKLDKLVDSNDYKDRIEAAEQGYRLDKLINDENELVFDAAYDYLKEHYYRSIFDWAKDNSVDLDIDEWLNSDSWTKRYAVAKHGYRLDKLINDEDDYVHWAVEDYLKEHSYNTIFSWAKDNNIDIDLNDWLNSDSWCKRRQVAKQGYGLDKLVCDEDWQVHNAAYDYLKKA